jgi:hypothetical protein
VIPFVLAAEKGACYNKPVDRDRPQLIILRIGHGRDA